MTGKLTPGTFVELRSLPWLIEDVSQQADGLETIKLSCIADDAQGEQLEVLWDAEIGATVLGEDNWHRIGASVQDAGVKIIDVSKGGEVDSGTIRAEAARIGLETEMLKHRTMQGIRRKQAQGIPFGNLINLREAQGKGTLAGQQNARMRRDELRPVIHEIRNAGASTGREIANELNKQGWQTPRGRAWCVANVRRVLRDIDRETAVAEAASLEYAKHPLFGCF